MELLQLRYFHTAAKLENFSKAAQQHYVPQSSISKTIARLEGELGVSLFDRHGKRVTLSGRGQIFFRHIDAALRHLDDAQAELTAPRAEKIHIAIRAGSKLMPALLSAFREKYPHILFSLALPTDDLPDDADCCILSPPLPPHLTCRTMLVEEVMLAVPLSHPLAAQTTVPVEQLREESFIAFSKNKSMRRLTDTYCKAHGFVPQVIFECDDTTTFRGLVETGLGIAFIPSRTWSHPPSAAARLLHLEGPPLERVLVLAWPKQSQPSPGLQLFLAFCETWFAEN